MNNEPKMNRTVFADLKFSTTFIFFIYHADAGLVLVKASPSGKSSKFPWGSKLEALTVQRITKLILRELHHNRFFCSSARRDGAHLQRIARNKKHHITL
jgi:hypothetical protein